MCAKVFWWINYTVAAAVVAAGAITTIVSWGDDRGSRPGLGLMLLGGGLLAVIIVRASQWLSRRPRSYDKAFDVGYELGEAKGYKQGRHSPDLRVVPLRTKCGHCGEVTEVAPVRKSTPVG